MRRYLAGDHEACRSALMRYLDVAAVALPETIVDLVAAGITGAAIATVDCADVAADDGDVEALTVSCVRDATTTAVVSVLGVLVGRAALEALT